MTDAELTILMTLGRRGGPDAVAFLTKLRVEHTARCRRGETFAITPKAMQRDNVLPGWSRERYERARDLLVLSGLIELVSGFVNGYHGRRSAQYRLATISDAGRAPISSG